MSSEWLTGDASTTNADGAAQTRGYSGADIENVCREAAMMALRADLDAIVVVRPTFRCHRLNFAV